ncbi:MAG: zinc ribbon domain-containing protein [Sedimentisphaerales bacterium]|nr:zinc ribbon domain-containing protein [Sedimentisphaerales bacterium]
MTNSIRPVAIAPQRPAQFLTLPAGVCQSSAGATPLDQDGRSCDNTYDIGIVGELDMPVYEFYCPDCHRIFNFLARRPDPTKQPACPRCGRQQLERRIAPFAVNTGKASSGDAGDDLGLPAGVDEDKMERALEEMASEAEGMDEEDPRQVARMMRRLCETTGLRMGEGLEEAMRRLEAGEDPDAIEEQMGDLLEDEDLLFDTSKPDRSTTPKKRRPPEVDPELYEL